MSRQTKRRDAFKKSYRTVVKPTFDMPRKERRQMAREFVRDGMHAART